MDSTVDFKSESLIRCTKLLRIAMNLLHLEGRPGLIPSDAPGMGFHQLSLTSAILGIPLTSIYIKNSLSGMPKCLQGIPFRS